MAYSAVPTSPRSLPWSNTRALALGLGCAMLVLGGLSIMNNTSKDYVPIKLRPSMRFASQDTSAAVKEHQSVESSDCTVSTKYISSQHEQAWLDYLSAKNSLALTEAEYCSFIAKPEQRAAADAWMKGIESGTYNQEMFSRFVTTTTCGQQETEAVTFIEPLSHGLRHPAALCDDGRHLMDMSYLLLAQQQEVASQREASTTTCQGRNCQAIYMDLGATTWSNTETEAGQGWFVRHYAKQGIEFDRLLLWEARAISPPSNIYAQLPQELMHKYQYFNIPATADLAQPSHPLRMLKAIAQPGDFVVLKLDIDHAATENSILQAFMDDPEAFSLVDEFFFEMHVNFAPMARHWGTTWDNKKGLGDAYKLFLELRQRGWRAHSWV